MKNKPLKRKRKWNQEGIKILLFPFFFLALYSASAQEAIPVSGGNASGEAGSLSYSVGQAVYTTVSGAAGILSQGVQQSYEITAVTGIGEIDAINLQISAYPNPVARFLILKTGDQLSRTYSDLHYRLMDMTGRMLHHEKIAGNETSIAMETYNPATYYVNVYAGSLKIKSFKIIKK